LHNTFENRTIKNDGLSVKYNRVVISLVFDQKTELSMHVKSLHYYPVKSWFGIDVSSAIICERGFENDRVFMVVDKQNVFMTQRDHPKMALIKPDISKKTITFSAPDMPLFSLNFSDTGTDENVVVWKDRCQAIDQGKEAANWLSTFLETSCKLVMMKKSFHRKLDPDFALSEKNQTGFADGYPFLLISQESLNDLNARLTTAIPMNRFRPNIVIEGCGAYDEDNWQRIKIGDITFDLVKPCVRCAVTTTDQSTLEKSKEPLATLATYRVSPLGGVIFGQNLIHHNTGILNVGDKIEILEAI
jgi:uncharacterized protein YcbX